MGVRTVVVYVLLPLALGVVTWYLMHPDPQPLLCRPDYGHNEHLECRPRCGKGQWSLPWMNVCQPWLTCREMQSAKFKIKEPLGNGAVKIVYYAGWQGHKVVLNSPLTSKFHADFKHGLTMLVQLQPSPWVTQLIGYCRDSYVTEYHPLGTAHNIHTILKQEEYLKYDTIQTGLRLCINYAEILEFLHDSPIGTRVMCDSNDLEKTLNQFLLTSDLGLVVNDLDALPLVDHAAGNLVKCGHRQLYGDFVAPEQRWPYTNRSFNDLEMPAYDEKTDIWKIPDVCDYFLGESAQAEAVRFHVYNIHKKCKSVDPVDRPSASEVLNQYRLVQKTLSPS